MYGAGIVDISDCASASCDSLAFVTFEGTMAEWDAVEKGWAWNDDSPFTEVKCSDGTVSV